MDAHPEHPSMIRWVPDSRTSGRDSPDWGGGHGSRALDGNGLPGCRCGGKRQLSGWRGRYI